MIPNQASSSPDGLNTIDEVQDEIDVEKADSRAGKNPAPSKRAAATQGEYNDFKHFIRSKLFIFTLLVALTGICILSVGFLISYERANDIALTVDVWKEKLSNEQYVWYRRGLEELRAALSVELNTHWAKNVILFVANGMGPATQTAARIYAHGEEGHLVWEKFPHMGLLKTYSVDKQLPDSFSTATALFGGVKTNYNTVGVDSYVRLGNCSDTLDELHHVESILHWAQEADLATGFVTTNRVVHGTPASLYSHTADQSWECEANMPSDTRKLGCKDIARQLFENAPGRLLNVIMGGGRQSLVSGVQGTDLDPVSILGCRSTDGRNLIADWEADKKSRDLNHRLVNKTDDLANLKGADYVLGIFANDHIPYEDQRDKSPDGQPSLAVMTQAALQVLQQEKRGFVLVVEGGLIDQAHRSGRANRALTETIEFDKAIAAAVERMRPHLDETLIIVASDHAQTLSINGAATAGTDVSVWAMGPMAHLFHRLHEQSYVAHVIAYAARIGRFKDTAVAAALLDILGFT